VLATNSNQQASSVETSPTCAYWRGLAIETLLELAAAREQLARVDDDQVELLSSRLAVFGDLLGGVPHESGYHRALAQEILAETTKKGRT
jgi:hypothetical protein